MKNDKESKPVCLDENLDSVLREFAARFDPNGIVRAVRGFDRAIRGFASWAATIDWSVFNDGRWQQHLVVQVAEMALERDDLSEHERHRSSGR
jgi:hypothetical protein